MTKTITISPITRLEGHGKIDILLDDTGNVADDESGLTTEAEHWAVAKRRPSRQYALRRLPAGSMTRKVHRPIKLAGPHWPQQDKRASWAERDSADELIGDA